MKHKSLFLFLPLVFFLFAACEKPLPEEDTNLNINPTASSRVVLLNEGSWGNNNSSLTLINNAKGTLDNSWFESANGRGLGDVAQDIIVYGRHAYVTVTFSNSLEVIDTATGHSTRLDLGDRKPRYITAANGKLFVTCYRPHSVVRIDTATLDLEATCILGAYNPEGIAAVGGHLFIASSYVQTSNSSYRRDSLLYVVDPVAMRVDTTLVVGLNPQLVVDIDGRHLAVNYSGDYSDGSNGTAIVDATTLTVSQLDIPLTGMCAANGKLFGFSRDGYSSESTANYYVFDPNTIHLSAINAHFPNTPYGINVDPRNGDIYVFTDGNYTATGDIICYTASGQKRWQASAGRLPRKAVFMQ